MAHFGGNEFDSFSVPLVYEGRYFVLEPGDPPLLSVFTERDGALVFEVLKNQPVENPVTDVSTNPTGVVTVSAKGGGFLYKVRPGSETSIALGRLGGGETPVRITDRSIEFGMGNKVTNCRFNGSMAGVVVRPDGGVGIGAPIPAAVLRLLGAV